MKNLRSISNDLRTMGNLLIETANELDGITRSGKRSSPGALFAMMATLLGEDGGGAAEQAPFAPSVPNAQREEMRTRAVNLSVEQVQALRQDIATLRQSNMWTLTNKRALAIKYQTSVDVINGVSRYGQGRRSTKTRTNGSLNSLPKPEPPSSGATNTTSTN